MLCITYTPTFDLNGSAVLKIAEVSMLAAHSGALPDLGEGGCLSISEFQRDSDHFSDDSGESLLVCLVGNTLGDRPPLLLTPWVLGLCRLETLHMRATATGSHSTAPGLVLSQSAFPLRIIAKRFLLKRPV